MREFMNQINDLFKDRVAMLHQELYASTVVGKTDQATRAAHRIECLADVGQAIREIYRKMQEE